VRDHRGGYYGGGAVARGPVRVYGGRYTFPGGVVRVYNPPVIRAHYYNYYSRPALIVENYDPVPGYVWMHGSWSWNGGEWIWVPGYWSVGARVVVEDEQ
jgi:hypothetical protein